MGLRLAHRRRQLRAERLSRSLQQLRRLRVSQCLRAIPSIPRAKR